MTTRMIITRITTTAAMGVITTIAFRRFPRSPRPMALEESSAIMDVVIFALASSAIAYSAAEAARMAAWTQVLRTLSTLTHRQTLMSRMRVMKTTPALPPCHPALNSVTDYWVSCATQRTASISRTTTSSLVAIGCDVTATTTTTSVDVCYSVDPNEDRGENGGGFTHLRPTPINNDAGPITAAPNPKH